MKRRLFLAAAMLAFSCVTAAAQSRSTADNYSVYDSYESYVADTLRVIELEQINVTATRANAETPVAHSEITKRELSKINFGQDIPYLLTLTPSVVATSDAGNGIGYTSVRIRGVDASRINVTSNGVPLNDAESHSVFWVNIPDIAASVEDMQVQRGVGTSTNGAGAFGGSINMRTEALALNPFAEASLSYGSFNTHKESFKLNTGLINGRWSFGARLSQLHSDGYIERASTDLNSFFLQGGYYGANTVVKLIMFGGKERTYHAWDGISASQLAENRRYNPCGAIKEIVRDADGFPVLNPDGSPETRLAGYYSGQTDNYAQTHYQAIINQRLGLRWNLNATLHFTKGDGYYEEYKNAATLTDYGLTPWRPYDAEREAYVKDGKVTKSNLVRRKQMDNGFGGAIASFNYTDDRLNISLGGAANRYDGYHFGNVIWIENYVGTLMPDHEYYRNHSIKDDANIFARANWQVARGLSVYGDLQYRYIHHTINGPGDKWNWLDGTRQMLDVDKHYSFFNPKAGLFYDIDAHNALYASFATAHKEPTRNNFTDAKFGTTPLPERLFDYELGYNYRGRTFSAGINLYYMDYKNQLVLTGEVNDIGEALSDNVAKSFRAGIEMTAGIQIARWLRWDLNATLSRNRILDYTEYVDDYVVTETGDWEATYTQSPIYIGNTDISFSPSVLVGSLITVTFGDFSASLQSQYVGRQYVTNSMQSGVMGADGVWEVAPLMLDAYFVNNLRLNYTFKLPSMQFLNVGLAVNNLFNAMYCNNGWGYSMMVRDGNSTFRCNDMGYFPQAGINVMGSVTLRF